MSRVIRTTPANDDILAIVTYIADHNPPAAERWLDQFDRMLLLLADQPHLGEAVEHLGNGMRRQILGNYLIFYRPLTPGIEVNRVLHSARKIEELFN